MGITLAGPCAGSSVDLSPVRSASAADLALLREPAHVVRVTLVTLAVLATVAQPQALDQPPFGILKLENICARTTERHVTKPFTPLLDIVCHSECIQLRIVGRTGVGLGEDTADNFCFHTITPLDH